MDLRTLQETPPWEWPEGAGRMVLAALRDEAVTEPDRALAAELAGDLTIMDDEMAGALLSTLERGDRSEDVRKRAALALGPVLEHADTADFDDPDDAPIAERTFRRIQELLRRLYLDPDVPNEVRRRILEASVRAPQDWHPSAVRAACGSDDPAWRLTAVFCMRFVQGFDDRTLEALESEDEDIHYQAVLAAGSWQVDAAWPHVVALVTSADTEKRLLLAAIEAVADIRPDEAADILGELAESDDEEVAEAVEEALAMAGLSAGEDEDGNDLVR